VTVIKVTNAEELRAALSVAESASGEMPTILLMPGGVIDLPLHVPDDAPAIQAALDRLDPPKQG
jgi:hypothetical protein